MSPLAEPVQEPGEKATLLGSWRGRSQGHWEPAASGRLPCSRPEMGDSEKQVWCHLLSNLQGIKEGCPVLGTSRQTQGRSGSQWRKLGQLPREGGRQHGTAGLKWVWEPDNRLGSQPHSPAGQAQATFLFPG